MYCNACGGSGKHRLMCPAPKDKAPSCACACGLPDTLKKPTDKHTVQSCELDDGNGETLTIRPGDLWL